MRPNRSIPQSTVIPELAYPDVGEAITWLCDAFGLTLRLRIANHRAQLNVGDGAMVVTQLRDAAAAVGATHGLLVRVEDVDSHYERATKHGVRVSGPPVSHPYGERQYTAVDLAGHHWTFSQSVADVDPADWGGELVPAGEP
jgi:uncharacterized glyoxalase superfamily protein PhnB